MTASRSIEQLIEEQVRRWEAARRTRTPDHRHEPVITVSRLPGCYGRTLSQELARRLKFDFFDKELLHKVAESSHLSETILKSVEEKDLPAVEEWVHSLLLERYISGDYFRHLSKVLMAIAGNGRAVILGRGAGFLLKPEDCLRVLLVAPLKDRILAVAGREGITREEAKRRVIQDESARRAFIQKHFHADMLDPTHYDLVINTAGLGKTAAIATIQAAWADKWKEPQPPAGAGPGAA